MMAWCLVGLLMIGQIFASSSELEWPIAHASHEVLDWAVTHCRAIHGCDSSSTVEWSKRVHTCQVEAVMCGGVYGCIWVCVGVYHGDIVYPEMGRPSYLHFTVDLCGKLSGETMSWLSMVGLTMDSLVFLLPACNILEHVMPPAGPLTFWSSLTSFDGLCHVPARQGEDRADLLGGSSI